MKIISKLYENIVTHISIHFIETQYAVILNNTRHTVFLTVNFSEPVQQSIQIWGETTQLCREVFIQRGPTLLYQLHQLILRGHPTPIRIQNSYLKVILKAIRIQNLSLEVILHQSENQIHTYGSSYTNQYTKFILKGQNT